MSSAVITLYSPQDYNLQSLAETTKQSLALLKPWTHLKSSPNDALGQKIAQQATKYTAAIQAGVSASYSGFTVTEEVLFLANVLPVEDQQDLQQYLVGMMELAKEARDNANKAYEAFRNVRKEIFTLASQVELSAHGGNFGEGSQTANSTRKGLPKYHRNDLEVLVEFSEHISAFANWWDWVKIESDPSTSKDQPISFQIDSLRDPEVVKRWNHLRSQYTAYVQMIGEIEDTDPEFFNLSPSPVQTQSDSVHAHERKSGPVVVYDSPSSQELHGTRVGISTFDIFDPPKEKGQGLASNESHSKPGKDKENISSRFARYFRAKYPRISKIVKGFGPRIKKTVKRMTLNSPRGHGQETTSHITEKELTMEPESDHGHSRKEGKHPRSASSPVAR
ncbi:hypothetical protein CPB84DRAFT_1905732 [Gymnopilus junonius]|uniref:Uncharacterized protein n=1 Tax=Gymnopilus junonius TaxID=109634 RepID=A0A9P5N9Y4_GYMJU|nr:hypothetical protein CPB84DRAFT_1905732 [Gymnopilus junonius]